MEKILEGNQLIAEFLGGQYTDYPDNLFSGQKGYQFPLKINNSDWWNKNALKFHTSWDWLMPVVEKTNALCKKTGYPDTLEITHLRLINTPIDYAHFAVIEFIQWYNNNKP